MALSIDNSSSFRAMSEVSHIKATRMSNTAASKLERGTKRTCQNSECGAKFYDLNREPIVCPICNTAYSLALAAPTPPTWTVRPYQKPVKKREVTIDDIRPGELTPN